MISNEPSKADDARYMLGRLLIEGISPEKVPKNESKGIELIKDAARNRHIPSVEYRTYYDIRFAS